MTIIKDFIPSGRRNRPGRSNMIKYVTIHETGNNKPGVGARNHAAYLKGDNAANLPASWHYTVDDGEIYQHIPETETAYHAGDGSGAGNTQSVGIEICVNSDGNFTKACDNAAALTADICARHKIPAANIKQHFDWSGKNCPENIRAGRPYAWSEFIKRVAGYMPATGAAEAEPPETKKAAPEVPAIPIEDVSAAAIKHASAIIAANEGSYGSINRDDNGALSVGKLQWHGSRALALMRAIINSDVDYMKIVLGDKLFGEIKNASANAWDRRTVTPVESSQLSAALVTAEGMAAQDKQIAADVAVYVGKGMGYGLTDAGALIYFADGVNQYGTASSLWREITEAALKGAGDATAMYEATKSLTSNYLARREKVYKAVLAIYPAAGVKSKDSPPPDAIAAYIVRVTDDTLNIRSGPGTNNAVVGMITDRGVYTITEEASGTGAVKWGRLKSGLGWISLDYTVKV